MLLFNVMAFGFCSEAGILNAATVLFLDSGAAGSLVP